MAIEIFLHLSDLSRFVQIFYFTLFALFDIIKVDNIELNPLYNFSF